MEQHKDLSGSLKPRYIHCRRRRENSLLKIVTGRKSLKAQSPNTPRFHSLVCCCTTHQEEKTSLSFTLYRTPRRINFLLFFFLFLLHFVWLVVCFLYRKQSLLKKPPQLLPQEGSTSLSSCRSQLLLQVKPKLTKEATK